MPHGNSFPHMSSKAVELATAEACIAIAQRVARAHFLADDRSGGTAAAQVARFIEEELIGRAPQNQPLRPLTARPRLRP